MMHFKTLVALLAWESVVVSATISSYQVCSTELGRSSVKSVPTTTKTVTIPLTAYKKVTSTPVKTVTPNPTTTTDTETKTITETSTGPAKTQTQTVTETDTETRTTTDVITETDTEVTTTQETTTSTSTVPTPAGFTPISERPDYVPKIKGRSANSLSARLASGQTQCRVDKKSHQPVFYPKLYPQKVSCVKFVKVVTTKTVTVTAKKTSTTTLPPKTEEVTTTETATTTETTFPPDVTDTQTETTTATDTKTETSTATTTTTRTETETVAVPGPTVYAACQPNNFITTANGGFSIGVVSVNQGAQFQYVGSLDQVACCENCQRANTSCRGSFIINGRCYNVILAGGTCDASQTFGDNYQTLSAHDSGFSVSNGPCAAFANGGNQDNS